MRILVLNWKDMSHPAAGGAEVYTARITEQWVRTGHAVTLFCARVDGCPAEETLNGVRILRQGGRFGVYAAARRWFRKQVPRSFDVIVDQVNTRPFLTPRWRVDTPVVALIHQVCREIWSYEMPWPVSMLGRFVLEPWWLHSYRDTCTLTVSPSSSQSLARYGLRAVHVVPEGVDTFTRPPVERAVEPTIIYVGRLAGNKRPRDVIDAFKLVRSELPSARLWMVGDGRERPRLEAAAGPNVTFFGGVDDATKHDLMARAHILAITSVREGWGLVVDEAAAMGTPSCGYDVAGLRDSIPASRGVLTGPSPDGLATALVAQLRDRRESLPQRGWGGGAVPWPEVAATVLEYLRTAAADGCQKTPG